MPHKHTRGKDAAKSYNLPPTEVACPLPVKQKASKPATDGTRPNKKRKRAAPEDDTPRAFARLMQLQSGKKFPSALDNGDRRSSKKAKTTTTTGSKSAAPAPQKSSAQSEMAEGKPRIQPGEKMSEFAARVDQALPVSGLSRKSKGNIEGIKERRTKTEKRMHKMYAEWREQEAKRKEKAEEAAEVAEEEEAELETELGGQSVALPEGKRARRKRMIGEENDKEEDPWARLKEERGARARLGDVVQAPPELKVVPKEKFKVKGGARVDVVDVPKKGGSLARREELGEARRDVIERYRAMMKAGRGAEEQDK